MHLADLREYARRGPVVHRATKLSGASHRSSEVVARSIIECAALQSKAIMFINIKIRWIIIPWNDDPPNLYVNEHNSLAL